MTVEQRSVSHDQFSWVMQVSQPVVYSCFLMATLNVIEL